LKQAIADILIKFQLRACRFAAAISAGTPNRLGVIALHNSR
jgi:hypothetical protein